MFNLAESVVFTKMTPGYPDMKKILLQDFLLYEDNCLNCGTALSPCHRGAWCTSQVALLAHVAWR